MNKNLSIIIFGRICQIFIMLVSIRLLTTLLSKAEVGNYYLIMALVAFFNLVFLNPPGMYFSRHLLSWKESNNVVNVLFVFFILILLLSIIGFFSAYTIFHALDYEKRFEIDLFLTFILSTFLISTVHRNIMSGVNILGYRKEFVFFTLTTLLIGLLSSVILINFYGKSALIWLLGTVLSELIILSFILRLIANSGTFSYQKIKRRLDKSYLKSFMIYAVPIAISTFLMWGQNFSYRFIVEYKYSIEVLSYLAVGITISSSIFGAIESIAIQYFNPIFLKGLLGANKSQRAESWNNMANKLMPIYVLCTMYVFFMAPFLVKILVDEKFYDVYIYTMIGATIEFFRVNCNLLNFVAQSELKTKTTVKPYLLGSCFTVGLLLIFDAGEKIYFVPAIMAGSYLLVFLFLYIEMKKLLNIKLEIYPAFLLFLSVPFSIPFFLGVQAESLIQSVFILGVFGIYLLFTIWKLMNRKGCLVND